MWGAPRRPGRTCFGRPAALGYTRSAALGGLIEITVMVDVASHVALRDGGHVVIVKRAYR
jgi:hypothetical protein